MNALLEQLLDELRGAWRFRWIAIAVAWVVCLGGWAYVLTMPDKYAASARVFVDTRTSVKDVTQGIAIDSNVDTQIQRVRQQLLGTPQLEQVARETDLDNGALTPKARQALIGMLRDRIEISASSPGGSAGVYVISYTDTNRDRSLRVVDRLVSTFVEGTLGGKKAGTEQAQRFLVDQIAEYERRLAAAEQRLADFKKEHVGLMPGAQGDYFSRLQTEMEALNKVEGQLNIATRRREAIQAQLRGERPFVGNGQGGDSTLSAANSETAQRIREAQAKLDDLLLRFTDKYPDVIALRQTISELEKRQREELESARRGDAGAAAQLGLTANPVFQSIQLQMNQADVDIAALKAEIGERTEKIANLRKLVNTAPEVEAEFARLNRDYGVTHSQYQALVERLERARLGEEADATGAVSLETIDPPTASFQPVAPNRPLLIAFVLVAGIGAGGALAYLLHQLKPVFNTPRQLAAITGLPVLGSVSMTWLEKYKSSARRGVLAFGGVAAMLAVAAAAVELLATRAVSLLHQLIA